MCTFLRGVCFSWSTGAPTRFTSCDQPCVPRQRLDENCDCQVGCDDRRIFRTAAPTSAQASIAQLQAGTRPSTRIQPHPPLSTLARSVLTCTSHAIYLASLRSSSTSSPLLATPPRQFQISMALNVDLQAPEGDPAPLPGEFFLLKRENITCTVQVAGQSKLKAAGVFYLSTQRIVFVSIPARKARFQSFVRYCGPCSYSYVQV